MHIKTVILLKYCSYGLINFVNLSTTFFIQRLLYVFLIFFIKTRFLTFFILEANVFLHLWLAVHHTWRENVLRQNYNRADVWKGFRVHDQKERIKMDEMRRVFLIDICQKHLSRVSDNVQMILFPCRSKCPKRPKFSMSDVHNSPSGCKCTSSF